MIRSQYEKYGVTPYYQTHGATYRNPHEGRVRLALQAAQGAWHLDTTRVLDLACGSGEATLALNPQASVGVDPYTHAAYAARTGQQARRLTFEAVAGGALAGERFSLVVCSYALHLLQASRLPLLGVRLAELAPVLVIVTPNKRPVMAWPWVLDAQLTIERTHVRKYVTDENSSHD